MNTKFQILIFCLGLSIGRVQAEHWTPPQALLDAVRQIESSNGRFVVGDNGRSLGDYQLSEAAWIDVSAWRKSRGLSVYRYREHVWNTRISRAYAADYLKILHTRLENHLRRCPNWGELYAAYNMGFAAFARRQFQLAKASPVTARKSLQIQALTSAGL